MFIKNKNNLGLTLIETIIYVAFLGLVSVLIVNFMLQASRSYQVMQADREVLSNARLILETLDKTSAKAYDIYTPTSRFNTDSGQLSLLVPSENDANHENFYVDFWITGGRLWMRQEGQGEVAISASSVKVDVFNIERILQGLNRKAVKMTLKISYNGSLSSPVASTTLNATMALRGGY